MLWINMRIGYAEIGYDGFYSNMQADSKWSIQSIFIFPFFFFEMIGPLAWQLCMVVLYGSWWYNPSSL